MTLTKWLKLKPMLASEFAAYMGVSTSAVSRWLNGHRRELVGVREQLLPL